MGLDGAAAGFVACTATSTALLIAYATARDWRRRHRRDATFRGLSLAALRGWGGYLALAVPALGAIAAEWLAYEGGGRAGLGGGGAFSEGLGV
jgi:hypothetical protein